MIQKGKRKGCQLICFLTVILLCVLCFAPMTVSAAGTRYPIDNDDAQGFSNTSIGFSSYIEDSFSLLWRRQKAAVEQPVKWVLSVALS